MDASAIEKRVGDGEVRGKTMWMKCILILLSLCLVGCNGKGCDSDDGKGVAHSLDSYAQAKCLDGSPGRFYYRKGFGSGISKFLIYHQGGGFCGSKSDCALRAGTSLGTTKNDDARIDLDSQHFFFSREEATSPLMYNWNHVMVRYCDGAYYSGTAGKQNGPSGSLYYNGFWITQAVFSELNRSFGLTSATDVVISGCSAGGIHVFAHLNELRKLVSQQAKVVGLADSGFYLDISFFTQAKRYVIAKHHGHRGALLDATCLQDYKGEEEKCLIASVNANYLTIPMFAWQSRFDSDQRDCEMSDDCSDSAACITEYADNLTLQIQRNLLTTTLPNQSRKAAGAAFVDSCGRHCWDWSSLSQMPCAGDSPRYNPSCSRDTSAGKTPLEFFRMWYLNLTKERFFFEAKPYDCDDSCAVPALCKSSAVESIAQHVI